MKTPFVLTLLLTSTLLTTGGTLAAKQQPLANTERLALLASLPSSFNSPASFTIDADNNVLFTSPNLHNDAFIKQGIISRPATPVIGLIDEQDQVRIWYTFRSADMEPTSGTVVPMGLDVGPDGNVYVADMQLWAGGESRILRLNLSAGTVASVDVVAKGLSFPNALVWQGDHLFISDTVLKTVEGQSTISGVYKVGIDELNAERPLQFATYESQDAHDPHLFETFTTNGSLGFGANGLAFDDEGNMYTGLMEEGTVFKTTINGNGNPSSTALFVQGMNANDGMHWDQRTQSLYITDLFDNAVYRIGRDGSLHLLASNGNTTGVNGELDAPGEVIVRGNKAYVNNFDADFGGARMFNTTPDTPVTISVIQLD